VEPKISDFKRARDATQARPSSGSECLSSRGQRLRLRIPLSLQLGQLRQPAYIPLGGTGNPRWCRQSPQPTGKKPCSPRESPPIPAQPGSATTSLSRRRSRIRVLSRSSAIALLARRPRASCRVIRLAWRPVQGHGHVQNGCGPASPFWPVVLVGSPLLRLAPALTCAVSAAYADSRSARLPDDDVATRLLALPRCGPYATAHMMMLLGRYSRLILDSWTRPKYGRLNGRKAGDQTIERRFRRHRG
jgi:hypothetical protein